MFGVTKIQSLNCIMGMKVEYKAAHSSRTQQYAHKNTMSAETGLSEWGLLCAGFHSQEEQWQVTKHGDMDSYCISEKQWEVCWEVKVTVFLSPLSHLSTQTAKKKKNKDGSDCNQKGRRQWKSQAHSLHLFPVLSEIDTSNTSRMTFTKSVLQSIKSWECQSSSQSYLVAEVEKGAGAECESEAAWKAAQKIGQEGTLFPSQQVS